MRSCLRRQTHWVAALGLIFIKKSDFITDAVRALKKEITELQSRWKQQLVLSLLESQVELLATRLTVFHGENKQDRGNKRSLRAAATQIQSSVLASRPRSEPGNPNTAIIPDPELPSRSLPQPIQQLKHLKSAQAH